MIPTPHIAAATPAWNAVWNAEFSTLGDQTFMALWRRDLIRRLIAGATKAAEKGLDGDEAAAEIGLLVAEIIEASQTVAATAEGLPWADALTTDLIRLSGEHEAVASAVEAASEAAAASGVENDFDAQGDEAEAPALSEHAMDARDAPPASPIGLDADADIFEFGAIAADDVIAERRDNPIILVNFGGSTSSRAPIAAARIASAAPRRSAGAARPAG